MIIDFQMLLNNEELGNILQSEVNEAVVRSEEMRLNADGRFSGRAYLILDGNAIPAQLRVSVLGKNKISASLAMFG